MNVFGGQDEIQTADAAEAKSRTLNPTVIKYPETECSQHIASLSRKANGGLGSKPNI